MDNLKYIFNISLSVTDRTRRGKDLNNINKLHNQFYKSITIKSNAVFKCKLSFNEIDHIPYTI